MAPKWVQALVRVLDLVLVGVLAAVLDRESGHYGDVLERKLEDRLDLASGSQSEEAWVLAWVLAWALCWRKSFVRPPTVAHTGGILLKKR